MEVFSHIKLKKDDIVGTIILLFGYPPRILYADMFPGANTNYEYITMYNENEKRIELRALNKYGVDDVTVITKEEYKSHINKCNKRDGS